MVREDEFSKILFSFLHNGICFRSDLLPLLITMLEDLQASIKALPTFRYYCCSLLLIYDGAVCPESLKEVIPVSQEVDFDGIAERAKHYAECRAEQERNREAMRNCCCDSKCKEDQPEKTELSLRTSEKVQPENEEPSSRICEEENKEPSSRMSNEELAQARCHVDLRMIDFAHATHPGFMDPIKHAACDHGYLKGLDTLLKIFKEMYCDMGGCASS